jgi:uncharacterized protein YceH (UPF0502 family)/2-methylisocitrate lyase-like PEP mutase family enzyme
MDLDLTEIEVRVLGCLIEKEHTTPDNYPLSTNALASAGSQKTSRDPVISISENDVDAAVLSLRDRGLARSLKPTGSRAWKHRHVTTEVIPLDDGELAVIAVLMLRGQQTPGELRTRTERIHQFESVEEVEDVLVGLSTREAPLTSNVGRGPGQSQDRWVHLLSGAAGGRTATEHAEGMTREPSASEASAFEPLSFEPLSFEPLRARFHELHERGTFVMPNPWDRGSARMMIDAGARALATTSAGYGRAIGKDDYLVTRDELCRHVGDLTDFVDVPLNVDSERLFDEQPGGVAESVRLLGNAGAAGCSIEDYQPRTSSIDEINRAAEAVAVAARACEEYGMMLTARAENHLYGFDDIDDTITRLQTYQSAGAHVLYAPGLKSVGEIELLLDNVEVPINVLLVPNGPTVAELAELGVRRISTGGALYNAGARAVRAAIENLGMSPH